MATPGREPGDDEPWQKIWTRTRIRIVAALRRRPREPNDTNAVPPDPSRPVRIPDPYTTPFHEHSSHSYSAHESRYVQLTTTDALSLQIGSPVGVIICDTTKCPGPNGCPFDPDTPLQHTLAPYQFIPYNVFHATDPPCSKPLIFHHNTDWLLTPSVDRNLLGAPPVFFIRIRSLFTAVTPENIEAIRMDITRQALSFPDPDSEQPHVHEHVHEHPHLNDPTDGLFYISEPEEVYEEYSDDERPRSPESSGDSQGGYEAPLGPGAYSNGAGPSGNQDPPPEPRQRNEDRNQDRRQPSRENTGPRRTPTPIPERPPPSGPQTRRRASEDIMTFFTPVPTTVPRRVQFSSLMGAMSTSSVGHALSGSVLRSIRDLPVCSAIVFRTRQAIYLFDDLQTEALIRLMNTYGTRLYPRRNTMWMFLTHSAGPFDDQISPLRQLSLSSAIQSGVEAYLLSTYQPIRALRRFPNPGTYASPPPQPQGRDLPPSPGPQDRERDQRDQHNRYRNRDDQDSQESRDGRGNGNRRARNRRTRDRSSGSEDHGRDSAYRRRDSGSSEEDLSWKDLIDGVHREMGHTETDGRTRKWSASRKLEELRRIGVKITTATEQQVILGLRMNLIPYYTASEAQRAEQKMAQPGLFKDNAQAWIKVWLEGLQTQSIQPSKLRELKPTYTDKRDANHIKQIKVLLETATPYPYSIKESNISTVSSHIELLIRFMIANSISHKMTSLVIEKSFGHRHDMLSLVHKESAMSPAYTEIVRGLMSYAVRTISRNLPAINNFEENFAGALAAVAKAFTDWSPDSGCRIAKEGGNRLCHLNRTLIRRTADGEDTETLKAFLTEDITRELLRQGSSVHSIWRSAEQSFGTNFNLGESTLGQILDFSSAPIDRICTGLKLASDQQFAAVTAFKVQPALKAGAATPLPQQPPRLAREGRSTSPGYRQAGAPGSQPGSRPQSPGPRRNPREAQPRGTGGSGYSAQPRERPVSRPTSRPGTPTGRKVCEFCRTHGYDCPAAMNHCTTPNHNEAPEEWPPKYARKREDCLKCQAGAQARSNTTTRPRSPSPYGTPAVANRHTPLPNGAGQGVSAAEVVGAQARKKELTTFSSTAA